MFCISLTLITNSLRWSSFSSHFGWKRPPDYSIHIWIFWLIFHQWFFNSRITLLNFESLQFNITSWLLTQKYVSAYCKSTARRNWRRAYGVSFPMPLLITCEKHVMAAPRQRANKEYYIRYNPAIQQRGVHGHPQLIRKDFSESFYIEEHPYLISVSGVKHLALCESCTCFIIVFASNVSYLPQARGGRRTEWFGNGFWHIHYSIWNTLKVYFTGLRLAFRAAISHTTKLIQRCCVRWNIPNDLSCGGRPDKQKKARYGEGGLRDCLGTRRSFINELSD